MTSLCSHRWSKLMLFGWIYLLGLTGCKQVMNEGRAKLASSFSLPNEWGKPVTVGKPWQGITVLVFYRGFWSSNCIAQLKRLSSKHYAYFRKAGVSIYGISVDPPKRSKRLRHRFSLKFPLLSDTKLKVIRRYKTEHWGARFSLSAFFVIGPQGKIRWRKIARSSFMRVTIEELLKEIQKVRKK